MSNITVSQEAASLALAILEPFAQSSLYQDYKDEDGWTDEQFNDMIEAFIKASNEADKP